MIAERRKIFLTGASAGIGLAVARELTRKGCDVWGTARHKDRLPAGLERFHPVELDLNREEAAREAFAVAEREAGGRFDVLINNAGSGWYGPGAEIPGEELRAQFRLLALGPISLVQMALPGMRREPGGLVINVTSLAARLPLLFGAGYSAAKAALSVYTRTLQMEEDALRKVRNGGKEGCTVRFVDLQPGDIRTDFNRAMNYWKGVDEPGDAVGGAVRQALKASDASMAGAPPPEKVARRIATLVLSGGENAGPMVTCGNFWQATLGPLAYRFLPPRLMLRLIRRDSGL